MGRRRSALEVLVRPVDAPWPSLTGAGAARLVDSGWRIVVTGAGGWLGLAALELLAGLLGPAFGERVVAFGARGRVLSLRGGVRLEQFPLAALGDLPAAPSLVLHLAFVTQGPAMTFDAAGYVEANRALSRTVLGALDSIGAEGVFQASSGAVHVADPAGGPQSKALYGALKLEDEAAFAAWAREHGRTAAIGRVFNTAGPYINRRATYALAAFIADALAGQPIRIQATRPVVRSYVAIQDLMSVVFGLLTDPAPGAARFETAGETAPEMADLAVAVAEALGSSAGVDRPAFDPAAPGDRYVGDAAVWRGLLAEFGVNPLGLSDQIRQTAAFMSAFPEAS